MGDVLIYWNDPAMPIRRTVGIRKAPISIVWLYIFFCFVCVCGTDMPLLSAIFTPTPVVIVVCILRNSPWPDSLLDTIWI